MNRLLIIACAIAGACGDGSVHSSDVAQFVGVWQVTGGSAGWHCSDGTSGDKSVGVGQDWTIGADTTHDLVAVSPNGCNASFDVAGGHATTSALVCEGKPITWDATAVLSGSLLTLSGNFPYGSAPVTCNEMDTEILARVAGR